jgi:hypothetical protein
VRLWRCTAYRAARFSALLMLAFTCFTQGCAAIPSPSVLSEIDRVRESRSAVGAKRDAPAAFAVAEKLRADAHDAFDAEDPSGAQILGERALAAYEEAVALARVVRADKEREGATAEVKKKETRLAELDNEHQQVAADIEAVERKVKVLRNLEPVSPSGPAGPGREKARWQAVASLHLGAQLLCSAANLLNVARGQRTPAADGKLATPAPLAEGQKALDDLNKTLATKPKAAPIDAAMRARASCLEALTRIRRGKSDPKKATGRGDALLEQLSKLGHGTPSRDDRGVVVTLRGVFDAGELNAKGQKALEDISSVGKKHGQFPVMVVVHNHKPLDDTTRKQGRAHGTKVVQVLRAQLGATRVAEPHVAGDASPVVDPSGASAARNARIDVVFVSPESM